MSIISEQIIAYYIGFPAWTPVATVPQTPFGAPVAGSGAKTDTQPVAEIGASKAGVHAASWGDLYFGWVHLVPSRLEFSFLLSRREDTVLVCNAHLTDDRTLISIDLTNTGGMTIDAGTLPETIEPLKDLVATISTEMAGPAYIDAVFTFNFDDDQAPAISCTGTRSMLFAFRPMEGLKEVLAWLTDVNEAYDGSEAREQVRIAPRQSFQGHYRVVGAKGRASLRALISGWQMRYFGYPVWAEAVSVGEVAQDDQWIGFDTAYADYKAGGFCLIMGEGWDDCELAGILDVQPDGLTLALPVAASYPRAAIMPVRIARMDGMPKYDETATYTEAQLGFAVEDNDPVDSSASAVQYKGFDTLLTPYGAPGQVAARHMIRPAEVIDGQTGKVLVDPRGDWGRLSFDEAHFNPHDRSEAWAYRQWLHRRSGRFRPVWVPTFERDVELAAGFSAEETVLVIYPVFYSQMSFDSPQFGHLAFFRTDGQIYMREVVNAQEVGDTEWITIDAALGFAGGDADFTCISFMPLCRLAADRVEIEWSRSGCCQSAVGLVGLDPDSES